MSIEANLKKIVTIDTTAKLNSRMHTIFKLDCPNYDKILKIPLLLYNFRSYISFLNYLTSFSKFIKFDSPCREWVFMLSYI